jgi:hypothetical protein
VGGWVADVTLCLHNGRAIQHFQSQVSLRNKIQDLQDNIRKYSKGTKFKGGEDKAKVKKLKNKLKTLVNRVANKFQPILIEPAPDSARQFDADLDEQSKICGAFVTFEHQESLRRCLQDYANYNSYMTRSRMPEPLKFQGHCISVRRAPEPSTIMWENLERTRGEKCCRRSITSFITLCLLLLSLTAISAITSLSNSKKRPELEYCGDDVMAMYYKPKNLDKDTGRYDFRGIFPDFEYVVC